MPDSSQSQLQHSLELIKTGRNQEAYQILNSLLQANPNNENAWWLMAHTVTDPGYVRLALENVVRLRPDYGPALEKLNDLNRQAGLPPVSRPPVPTAYPTPPTSTESSPPVIDRPAEDTPVHRFGFRHLLGGILLGLIAGVVAGVLWVLFTILQTGEEIAVPVAVVVLIGGAVGTGAYFGTGRKRSIVMALISAAITFVVMSACEFMIIRHFYIQVLGDEGDNLGKLVDVTVETVVNDPVNPPTLVWWGAALLVAFVIPLLGRGRRAG